MRQDQTARDESEFVPQESEQPTLMLGEENLEIIRQPTLMLGEENLEILQQPAESLELILEAHFERFTKDFIDKLIKDYGEDSDDSPSSRVKGLVCAVEYLYKAVNLDKNSFLEFIHKDFDHDDEEYRVLYRNLNSLSNHCSNNIESADPVFMQCKRLSILDDDVLKVQISNYFKDNTNSYLREKHPHIYGQIERDHQSLQQGSGAKVSAMCQ